MKIKDPLLFGQGISLLICGVIIMIVSIPALEHTTNLFASGMTVFAGFVFAVLGLGIALAQITEKDNANR